MVFIHWEQRHKIHSINNFFHLSFISLRVYHWLKTNYLKRTQTRTGNFSQDF